MYGILLLTPGYARDAASGRLVISVVPVRLVQGTLLCMYVAFGIAKGISGDWLKYYDWCTRGCRASSAGFRGVVPVHAAGVELDGDAVDDAAV